MELNWSLGIMLGSNNTFVGRRRLSSPSFIGNHIMRVCWPHKIDLSSYFPQRRLMLGCTLTWIGVHPYVMEVSQFEMIHMFTRRPMCMTQQWANLQLPNLWTQFGTTNMIVMTWTWRVTSLMVMNRRLIFVAITRRCGYKLHETGHGPWHSIQTIYAGDSDDKCLDEEIDEDGLTAKEAEDYNKVIGNHWRQMKCQDIKRDQPISINVCLNL